MNCRDCGEPIQLLPNEAGKLAPFDFVPRSHYTNAIHIAAVRKNGAEPKKGLVKVATPTAERALAVAGLVALKYKALEAHEMLRDIPEGEPQEMVLAALKRKGEE